MRRSTVVTLFNVHSYFMNVAMLVVDCLPPPLRVLVIRLLLSKLGAAPLIDYRVYFRYPQKISIGNNVSINRGCEFFPSMRAAGGTITIGNNVAFGPHVKVFAASHDYSRLDLPDTAGPVVINDHVWIGGNATIMPGVVLGEGAVIGAGAVVTKDIPPYSLAVGNPARVIKKRKLS
jgi:acetyltransferase-like isoleucine patch superfamily enzyme